MDDDFLTDLIKKFELKRKNSKGKKKVVYSRILRKKAAQFARHGYPKRDLAVKLGVSVASIKSWIKQFTPPVQDLNIDDIIPVNIESSRTNNDDYGQVAMKVTCVEVSVPFAEIGATISSILSGMGGLS